MKQLGFLLFALTLSNTVMLSQDLLLFVEDTELLEMKDVKGPLCKAFADVNGDYRDDIIRQDRDRQLLLELNSNNGKKYSGFKIGTPNSMPYTISIGDVNNNGSNEVITAGYYDGMSIWSIKNDYLEFETSLHPEKDFFAQASNLVDINNDGWLDIFICNDDGLSKIFINDGVGEFTERPELIDMRTEVPSDNSGNYASEWTDVDGDGDLDLYIAKCRLGVDSPSDPRRINTLYINNDGVFTETAKEFGINIGAQSWTGNFGDIDNDGDMDLFLTNHDAPCMLFENKANESFEEIDILNTGEPVFTEAYQSAIHDLNNDGFLDIIIGGLNDMILVNRGDNTFTKLETPFGFTNIISFALGDADRDGFTDVLASYNLFGNSGGTKDKLWLNLTNNNHFINITLQGTESNRNGIGAKLELYGNWGKQTRIIQSGSGYTVTHSLSAQFGLGAATTIDSLVVNWPSGTKDVYTNLGADAFFLAIEDTCCELLPDVISDADQLDCDQKEIRVNSENDVLLEWSNGQFGLETIVDSIQIIDGIYNVTDNCDLPVQSIFIDTLPRPNAIGINIEDSLQLCTASQIILSTRENSSGLWSSNVFDNEIALEQSGIYYIANTNKCDTVYSDTLYVNYINPDVFSMSRDTQILEPEAVSLYSDKEAVIWYLDPERKDTILKANILLTDTVYEDTSFYFDYSLDQTAPSYIIGPSIDNENLLNTRSILPINLAVLFEVENSVILKSINTFTEQAGPRVFEIIDQETNNLVFSDTLTLEAGANKIGFNVQLPEGEYLMQTNESFNQSQFQTPSPLLATYDGILNYPYKAEGVLEIKRSLLGTVVYPYFFDWRFEPLIEECRSGLNTLNISVMTSATKEELTANAFVYPNPFGDRLYLDRHLFGAHIEIYHINGQKLFEDKMTGQTNLDLSFLPSGIYIFKSKKDGEINKFKLIKQ